MNLKLVVTTMIVAGAVSANAFADQSAQAQMDAMKAQMNQMQAAINANNAGNNLPAQGWFNRISLSGLGNIDLLGAKSYSPTNYTGKNPSAIAVSSAALFVDADVSDWTKAHVGLAYSTANQNTFNLLRPGAYTYNQYTASDSQVNLDELYATIGNFSKSPLYLKAGKQYLPFGSYTPFANITQSTTEILSQVNEPAAVAGFVTNNGFNGSIYGAEGLQSATSTGQSIRNYGANLALTNAYNNIGYNVGISYLANMADTTGIKYELTEFNNSTYTNAVNAAAANLSVKYSAFDVSAKYVSALKHFSATDLDSPSETGSKPSAWSFHAGYSFPVIAHDSRFALGYQGSAQTQAVGIGATEMPQRRYLADYAVNVSKYTDLGFEIRHDRTYNNVGYAHPSTNTGVARLAVKFA